MGDRIKFAEEKQRYTVQAAGERYFVCSKPFNPKRTVLYCIVDTLKRERGPENFIFGLGAETREQCEEMLQRVECERSQLSYRRKIGLNIESVAHP